MFQYRGNELVVEDELGDRLHALVVEPFQIGEAPADHDRARVENIDHIGETATEALAEFAETGLRIGILGPALGNFDHRKVIARALFVVCLHGRTGEVLLDTPPISAITRARIRTPGPKGMMSPLPGHVLSSPPDLAAH